MFDSFVKSRLSKFAIRLHAVSMLFFISKELANLR
jgi:hypothetical protein